MQINGHLQNSIIQASALTTTLNRLKWIAYPNFTLVLETLMVGDG